MKREHAFTALSEHVPMALCGADNKWLYTVALPKKIVRVHEHILAPEYRQGELLMYRSPDGANTPATAIATDPTYWQVM